MITSSCQRLLSLLGAGLAVLLFLPACDTADPSGLPPESVYDVLQSVQEMSAFAGLVAADTTLTASMRGDDTYTVLTPRAAAFEELDRDTLAANPQIRTRVLYRHLVTGEAIVAGDITDGMTVTSALGAPLVFSTTDGLRVNDAPIVSADVSASNGVVHVLETALLDAVNAMERVVITTELQPLEQALTATPDLAAALRDDGAAFTLLAPDDSAFVAAIDTSGDRSVSDAELGQLDLGRVLPYHVLPGITRTTDIPTTPTTLSTRLGEPIRAVRDAGTGAVTFILPDDTEVGVQTPNLTVRNGVVHVVDSLLVPPQP